MNIINSTSLLHLPYSHHDVKRRKLRLGQHDVRISRATFNRHPELVSGSVRGQGQEKA